MAAAVALTVSDGETSFALLMAAAELARQTADDAAQAVAVGSAVITATRFTMSITEPVPHGVLADRNGRADRPDRRAGHRRAGDGARGRPDHDRWSRTSRLSRAAAAAARRTGDAALVLGALDALGTALANAGHLRQAHRLSDERLRLAGTTSRYEPAVAAEPAQLKAATPASWPSNTSWQASAFAASRASPVRQPRCMSTKRE